jgi:hypothetical protein
MAAPRPGDKGFFAGAWAAALAGTGPLPAEIRARFARPVPFFSR